MPFTLLGLHCRYERLPPTTYFIHRVSKRIANRFYRIGMVSSAAKQIQ